ncbi:hypothetical protein GCK32_016597 [Trichostrongylus colubriformis]|uniref:Uncharacterized protein n=1 Tax=Trichostrongylus colubriformis TaxID=6319 RepID=A0AAN8J0J8_TRICO
MKRSQLQDEICKPPNQEESSNQRQHQDTASRLSEGSDHSHDHSYSTDVTSRKESSPSFMFIEGDVVDLNLFTARSDSSTDVSACRSTSSDVLTARSESSTDVTTARTVSSTDVLTARSVSSSDLLSAKEAFEESDQKSPIQKSRFTSDLNMQLMP